jgi:hypothetical protein
MDRKNIWILGGAIVLGFLAFGLSQSRAQRFPGDGRVGGGENMVGRYQVVRSSPETVLLLDTVTGELYSAGRDDIRPTSARRRSGEIAGPDTRKEEKSFEDVPVPRQDDRRRFTDKAKEDFKDAPRHDFKDKK